MWRFIKVSTSLVVAGGASYLMYDNVNNMIFKFQVGLKEEYFLYTKKDNIDLTPKLEPLGIPVFQTPIWSDLKNLEFKLDSSSTGLTYVRKLNGKYYSSPLDSHHRFEKWLKFLQSPYKSINTREELLDLLKSRKKSSFLDSFILIYAPKDDKKREENLNQAIIQLYFKDCPNKFLTSSTSPYLHLVRITNPILARELKIDSENFNILKIGYPQGTLSTKKLKKSYKPQDELDKYYFEQLQQSFMVNAHKYQLDNQLFFDRFQLSEKTDEAQGEFTSIDELFNSAGVVNPLILPIFNTKHLILTGSRVFLSGMQENAKILIVSYKNNKCDRSLESLHKIIGMLGLEKFAHKNPDILTIIGNPEYIYHLPLKDLAIYHFEDIEIRLLTVNKGTVVDCQALDEKMTFEDLLGLTGPRRESSPCKNKTHAVNLDIEKYNEKILNNTDRCAFVMNCSKTCPACEYADFFFQKAAGISARCQFYKYYVTNHNPIFKSPNSTPRFHLFLPGTTEPVVYEQREHGVGIENFLGFIDKKLD